MTRITVLLADDHTLIREGLRAVLELANDFDIVGEAENGLQAVALAAEFHPDVVVMDIAMPKLNGIEAARQILQQVRPAPKILMLSAYVNVAHIEQAVSVGVAGYLVKQTSAIILAKTIQEIHAGKVVYSPAIAQHVASRPPQSLLQERRANAKTRRLTPREREVLQLIAEGNLNKEVADRLGISIKTVEKHRQSLMDKLDIHDVGGLTRYAISAGIIEDGFRPAP